MSTTAQDALIFLTGLLAGFMNTLGGGGSSLIYPLLIFLGLSPHQAVGSARLSFLAQGFFGAYGYRKRGHFLMPFGLYAGLAAMAGAFAGAAAGLAVPPLAFKRIIALVIALVSLAVLFGLRFEGSGDRPAKGTSLNVLLFFFLGMYSGFIQTGLGFLILAVLAGLNRLNIHRANSVKAMVILLSGIPSLLMYAAAGQVVWPAALWLAAGMGTGAFLTAYFSVRWPERLVKYIIAALVLVMAVRLWVSS